MQDPLNSTPPLELRGQEEKVGAEQQRYGARPSSHVFAEGRLILDSAHICSSGSSLRLSSALPRGLWITEVGGCVGCGGARAHLADGTGWAFCRW